MATNITRNLKEINAEVVKLDNGIKGVTRENKQLDASLKLDPSSTVLLTQKTENLQKQISLATQKVAALKDAQRAMREQVENGTATEEEYKKITVEVAKAEAQVKSFAAQIKQADNQKLTNLQNSLKSVSKVSAVALASIAALGYKYADTGDKISKASAKYKISAEEFQHGANLFNKTTGSADGYASALENVQKQISAVGKDSSSAINAFAAIGISLEDLSGKGAADVLDLIMEKLGGVADADERLTLANTLLSSAGYEVAQVAELTAGEVAALNEQLEANGLLTQDQADKAAGLKDSWEDFQMQLQAVIMELAESLLPLMQSLIQIVSFFIPIISALAGVFSKLSKPVQFIVGIMLLLLTILPKLIGVIKLLKEVVGGFNLSPLQVKIMLIVAAVVLLGTAILGIINLIRKFQGKSKLDLGIGAIGNIGAEVDGMVSGAVPSEAMTTTENITYGDNHIEVNVYVEEPAATTEEITQAVSEMIALKFATRR